MTYNFSELSQAELLEEKAPCPQVLARWDDNTDPRSATKRIARVTIEIPATAESLSVTLFESLNDANRGGVILEVETELGGSGFQPVVVQTERGVQLHMAGDGEAKALLVALQHLLVANREDRGRIGSVCIT